MNKIERQIENISIMISELDQDYDKATTQNEHERIAEQIEELLGERNRLRKQRDGRQT